MTVPKKLLHDAKDLPIDYKPDHRVLKLMRTAHEMIGEFAYQPNNTFTNMYIVPHQKSYTLLIKTATNSNKHNYIYILKNHNFLENQHSLVNKCRALPSSAFLPSFVHI
jgi:hypothetical protein